MLFKTKQHGKTLVRSKPLLLTAQQGYSRPPAGKAWFQTTTTVWRVDELMRRRVRDWRRLLNETGHTNSRSETMRADHNSIYTGTHSVFPAPLVEWILLRYGGAPGGHILDPFAGGPPRAAVSSLMGYKYTGYEVRQEQIDENVKLLQELELTGAEYVLGDGRLLCDEQNQYDCGIACPPYWNLEEYSQQPDDLSNMATYAEFNASMALSAASCFEALKPDAFMCVIVGPFRDKNGELVDFRAHTVENYRDVGFIFWQEIILSKNFASAAKRGPNAWRGFKLVPTHEYLLIFKKPKALDRQGLGSRFRNGILNENKQ